MTGLGLFTRCKSRIADFAERECLLCEDGGVSVHDICRAFVRDEEFAPDREEDVEDDIGDGTDEDPDPPDFPDERIQRVREDSMRQRVWEAFDEARARAEHCGDGFYPFELAAQGTILRKRQAKGERKRWEAHLYLFLLLATWETDRGAAALFERLCRFAAHSYWGGGARVRTFLIGDQNVSLKDKINLLAKELGEGGGFDSSLKSGKKHGDGGMDIAVFRRFADNRAGQLIGFGQCKTGHSYRNELTKSSPGAYVNKWFRKNLLVNPVGLFFVADRIATPAAWRDISLDSGGVVFDRCRVMEHALNADDELRNDIATWIRVRWQDIGRGPFPF